MDITVQTYFEYYDKKDSDTLRKQYWTFRNFLSDGLMCDQSKEIYNTRCDAIRSVLTKRLEW
jgi:hypothetical protein